MFSRLLPPTIDNRYHGHKAAIWIAIPLTLLQTLISFNSLFFPARIAQTADGFPLDTYSQGAAQAVVLLFALGGLAGLFVGLLSILTLIRYRAAVPLMYVFLLLEFVSRRTVLRLLPIARTGTGSPVPINLIFLVLILAGFLFSLRREPTSSSRLARI